MTDIPEESIRSAVYVWAAKHGYASQNLNMDELIATLERIMLEALRDDRNTRTTNFLG